MMTACPNNIQAFLLYNGQKAILWNTLNAPNKQSTTRQVESQIHWRRQGERHIQQSILQETHGSTHTRLTPKLGLLNTASHLFTNFQPFPLPPSLNNTWGSLQSWFPPDRRSRPHKNPSKSTCFMFPNLFPETSWLVSCKHLAWWFSHLPWS